MPKFQIEVSFDLTTEIEVEVDRHQFLDPSGVDEYEDDSYWQSAQVESSGGNLKFQIEAEDEDDASRQVEERIFDGQEIEDRNGLTWLTESVHVDIEEIEPPMDLAAAKQIVGEWLSSALLPEELKEALRLILDHATASPFDS